MTSNSYMPSKAFYVVSEKNPFKLKINDSDDFLISEDNFDLDEEEY